MARLSAQEVTAGLEKLPGWSVMDGKLYKDFTVRSFAHAVLLVGAIGQLAEAAGHHPDLFLHDYKQLTVTIVDHHDGGISERCTKLAGEIEALPQKRLEPEKASK